MCRERSFGVFYFTGGVKMEETKLSEKTEFFGKAAVGYVMLGKIEDVKVSLWHIHSLADLLICKYQELLCNKELVTGSGFSSPILSIAEMLTAKAEAALNDLDEIEIVGDKLIRHRQ